MDIDIDEKFIEEARQISMRISKSMIDLDNMIKFIEEFTGVLHHMVLDLYQQTGKEMPKHIKDYKFKNKNPWNCIGDDLT